MFTNLQCTEGDSVQVVEAGGTWFVRVVESGQAPHVSDFEIESFARVFAEGQRRRLGLNVVDQI